MFSFVLRRTQDLGTGKFLKHVPSKLIKIDAYGFCAVLFVQRLSKYPALYVAPIQDWQAAILRTLGMIFVRRGVVACSSCSASLLSRLVLEGPR